MCRVFAHCEFVFLEQFGKLRSNVFGGGGIQNCSWTCQFCAFVPVLPFQQHRLGEVWGYFS